MLQDFLAKAVAFLKDYTTVQLPRSPRAMVLKMELWRFAFKNLGAFVTDAFCFLPVPIHRYVCLLLMH